MSFHFRGFPCGSAGKESTCNMEDLGSIPGLGRSPGEGKGYPLQYSGLENSVDYIVHGVVKSQTRPSDFDFHFIHIFMAVRGLSCSTRDLQSPLWHVGSSSLIRNESQAPCIGSMESYPLDYQGGPCGCFQTFQYENSFDWSMPLKWTASCLVPWGQHLIQMVRSSAWTLEGGENGEQSTCQ